MAPVWGAGLARRARGDAGGIRQPPPQGSLGRRVAAQRRWQGAREAIAIAEDTVPDSGGPLRHRPPPQPPGTRPLGPSSSQEAGPGKGQAGRGAGA